MWYLVKAKAFLCSPLAQIDSQDPLFRVYHTQSLAVTTEAQDQPNLLVKLTLQALVHLLLRPPPFCLEPQNPGSWA